MRKLHHFMFNLTTYSCAHTCTILAVPHFSHYIQTVIMMHSIYFKKKWSKKLLQSKFLFGLEFLADVKGQLILKCPFGVFKSSKKPTNFFQDFCSKRLGQKSWKKFRWFFGSFEDTKRTF